MDRNNVVNRSISEPVSEASSLPGGFNQLVEDMISLRIIAKNEHPGKPYLLLGHSMGSFAAVC